MSWQDDFVMVKNETETIIEWDGKEYRPGSQATVPYLKMINTFGDPRSTPGSHQVFRAGNGEQGVIQPREVELGRVMTYWKTPGTPLPSFYDMDGNRIFTVADDPRGEKVAPANPTVEQQTFLEKQVAQQQEIINRLLAVAGLDKDALPQSYTPTDAIPVDMRPGDASAIPVDESVSDDTQSPWAHAQVSLDEDASDTHSRQ